MRKSNPAIGVLLTFLLCSACCVSLRAEHLHESAAQILRIEANTVYAWVDARIIPTTDFTLELKCGDEVVSSLPIAGVLDHVITTQKLSDDIIAKVRQCPQSGLVVYLNSEVVSDSLIIAMPANLRELWLDTLWFLNAILPVRYHVRYFDDLREVFIAARLEQVDLLVMPEVEIPGARILSGTPAEIEWNLLCPGVKDDLFASALNYCLRGILASDGDHDYSSLILPEHLRTLFPRNPDHARELFHQTRLSRSIPRCDFHGFKMYPVLTEKLFMALSSCNGGKLVFEDDSDLPLKLALFAVPRNLDSNTAYIRALRELADPLGDRLQESSGAILLDSCLLDPSFNSGCRAIVSRAVAEFSRIIPLGRLKLAVQKSDHVRFLDDRSDSTSLDAFYTIRK